MVRGPQKQCSHVSDMQIHNTNTQIHKYTNTKIQIAGNTRLTLFGAKRTIYHLSLDCPMTLGYVQGMLDVLGGHQEHIGGDYW